MNSTNLYRCLWPNYPHVSRSAVHFQVAAAWTDLDIMIGPESHWWASLWCMRLHRMHYNAARRFRLEENSA